MSLVKRVRISGRTAGSQQVGGSSRAGGQRRRSVQPYFRPVWVATPLRDGALREAALPEMFYPGWPRPEKGPVSAHLD